MNKTIKGIIFDVDGVIIDSENIHFFAYKEVLKQYHFDLDHTGYKKWFSGKSIEGGITSFLDDNNISIDHKSVKERKVELTKKFFQDRLAFYHDTVKFIEKVNSQSLKIETMSFEKPLNMALTTGLKKILIDEMFKIKPDLKNFFSVIITPEDYTHSKPDPDCYIKTAKKMNISLDSLIGIEDTPSGVRALNNAGIFSIALTTTHSRVELTDANLIVDKLTSLY